jgi:itaconyl-CoA hydratase
VQTRGLNQDGKIVIEYARSVMVGKRGEAPSMNTFPEPAG